MKKRLLTVGCSFTYGEELSDPSTHSWPALLANEFDYELTNLGKCGGSNDYIFRSTVEYTVDDRYDLVTVQWTEPSRAEVWNERNRVPVNISANPSGGVVIDQGLAWVQDYYKYSYNEQFAFRNWTVKILTLQHYLNSIHQPYIMVSASGLTPNGNWRKFWSQLQHLWSRVDAEHYVGWPHVGLKDWYISEPVGPGQHPLESGHRKIADEIAKHIRH
jgi:hypothetical protein